MTRSLFRFGLPFQGFGSEADRPAAQRAEYDTFITRMRDEILAPANDAQSEVRVLWQGDAISAREVRADHADSESAPHRIIQRALQRGICACR